jgi:hypothetical protein
VTATEAVTEYLAYVAVLSIAVASAIIAVAYAANSTIKWLDAMSKPAFFDSQTLTATGMKAGEVQLAEHASFAVLPAPVPERARE